MLSGNYKPSKALQNILQLLKDDSKDLNEIFSDYLQKDKELFL